MELPLDLDVLLAVLVEPREPFRIVEVEEPVAEFILPALPRPRHLVHQLLAGGIFPVGELERVRELVELRRQAERQRRRHGADDAARAGSAESRTAGRGCAARSRISNASLWAATIQSGIGGGLDEFRPVPDRRASTACTGPSSTA